MTVSPPAIDPTPGITDPANQTPNPIARSNPPAAQPSAGPSHHSPSIQSRLYSTLAALAVLGLVAWVDSLTGPNIHIGFLYWMPVAMAAWLAGRWPAYFLVAVATWFWRHFSEPTCPDILAGVHIWLPNLLAHLIYYPAIVEVVLRLRNEERRLERQVSEHFRGIRRQGRRALAPKPLTAQTRARSFPRPKTPSAAESPTTSTTPSARCWAWSS